MDLVEDRNWVLFWGIYFIWEELELASESLAEGHNARDLFYLGGIGTTGRKFEQDPSTWDLFYLGRIGTIERI